MHKKLYLLKYFNLNKIQTDLIFISNVQHLWKTESLNVRKHCFPQNFIRYKMMFQRPKTSPKQKITPARN